MKNLLKKSAALLAVLSFSACGTIFGGKSQNISFNTPDGEKVKVEIHSSSGTRETTIPGSATIPKNNHAIMIKVKDKCYKETSQSIPARVSWLGLANFLFGLPGTTSAAVDVSSGAFWNYDENINIPAFKKDHCE